MVDVFTCIFAFIFCVALSALLDVIASSDYFAQEERAKDKAFHKHMKLKKQAAKKELKQLRNQRPTTF